MKSTQHVCLYLDDDKDEEGDETKPTTKKKNKKKKKGLVNICSFNKIFFVIFKRQQMVFIHRQLHYNRQIHHPSLFVSYIQMEIIPKDKFSNIQHRKNHPPMGKKI
jgi:hypothetical protein